MNLERAIRQTEMNQPDGKLYLLAQEWASLRARARTEQEPNRLRAIADRLLALLREAEELMGFNDEDVGQDAASDAMHDQMSNEKSGASD